MIKIILFTSLLLANLAWLLNPHACCPRDARIIPGYQVKYCAGTASCGVKEASCCAKEADCCSPETVQSSAPEEASPQTDTPIRPFFTRDSQLSKCVTPSVSDATSDSMHLLQTQREPMVSKIIFTDPEIPDSAIIPLFKKPPRV